MLEINKWIKRGDKMIEPFNKLDKYFLEYNKITEETVYEIFDICAVDLFTANRIDLVVKYYYIECREKKFNLDFAKELYTKHIEAFTDGTFTEHGNPNKNSIEKYFEVFNHLIDNFKEKGYTPDISLIPVGKNYEILDGSHRTACAAYFNQKVKVIRFPKLSVNYDLNFFRRRLLDDYYLDFMAKRYLDINDKVYLLFSWPKTKRRTYYIKDVLEKHQCKVIYTKKLKFNRDVFWHLIYQIYKNEHWIGYIKNNFKGITEKAELCYDPNGYLGLYILECPSLEALSIAKDELRIFFGIGKSSIHTSDTKEETIEILNFILNKNCQQLLHNSFHKNKNINHSIKKYFGRKVRHAYRVIINKIKVNIGKPV